MSLSSVIAIKAIFLVSIISFLPSELLPTNDCQIEAEINISQTANGGNIVRVKLKKEISDLNYYFLDSDKKVMSFGFDSNEIENLPPGKYHCLVVLSKDCYTKIDFEI